jgi:hypothetical protein
MIKSLLPPGAGIAIKNIETTPASAGPNPNINTTIKF